MTSGERSQTAATAGRPKWDAWLLLAAGVIAGAVALLIFRGVLPAAAGIVAAGLLLTALFWTLRGHLPSILLVFATVLLAGVVLTQRPPKVRPDHLRADEGERLARKWAASGRFDRNLPIVLHLVFDELMSVGAMTSDLPNGSRARQALLDFGEKHSFRTFDSVYSRYYYTADTFPNLMNRAYLGRDRTDPFLQLPFNEKTKSYSLGANAYFDDMARRGYRTAVFQTSYIDFCGNRNVDLCETFDSFDPGGNDPEALEGPTQKVRVWQTVLRAYEPSYTSELGRRLLGRVYGLPTREVGVIGDDSGGRYDVHRFPEWFDRFTRFAATVPRGTHVFAHFLVPHAPYLLLESCVVSGKIDAGYYLFRHPAAEQAARRRDYYGRYLAQVGCVASKLDQLMSTIGQSGSFRDAVIVIHGDHGSRISIGDIVEDYSERDFVDNYGAFFAVRAPGVTAGLDCEFVSLGQVFHRYVARDARRGPDPGAPPPVVVLSRTAVNTKIEVPMPRFGCAAEER